ncbi:hypothetical protein FOZ63_028038 [Perkinsus olseni]|uniref:Uncharacterized protein n=1 Tax=Perkinsus olseni TaxID=32597 RepID=A0A7J6NJT3_PEROL|nr:hypothetical protein FOZ60_008406 [Perkinsus olseni]KAF4705785.1 hypothetical protein FOZ63_028038 [Perkinsus olseni]
MHLGQAALTDTEVWPTAMYQPDMSLMYPPSRQKWPIASKQDNRTITMATRVGGPPVYNLRATRPRSHRCGRTRL